MPAQMLGRPIIRKQTDYGFYRPAAYQIANTLADMPFSATRILIYDIIIYFMTHLARSPGRFFTFHLINYTAFLTMQGFFRTIGLFFSDYHTAYRMAMAIFPNLIMYIGYIVPINQMKRWLFWIVSLFTCSRTVASHHVPSLAVLHQPIKLWMVSAYGKRVSTPHRTYSPPPSLRRPHPFDPFMQLTCDGAYIIPRNIGNATKFPYDAALLPDSPSSYITRSVELGPNQACTLFGARPGTSAVTGKDYIKAGYNLNTDDLWRRNVLVLFAFLLFFWFTQTVIIEVFPVSFVNSLFEISFKLTVSV